MCCSLAAQKSSQREWKITCRRYRHSFTFKMCRIIDPVFNKGNFSLSRFFKARSRFFEFSLSLSLSIRKDNFELLRIFMVVGRFKQQKTRSILFEREVLGSTTAAWWWPWVTIWRARSNGMKKSLTSATWWRVGVTISCTWTAMMATGRGQLQRDAGLTSATVWQRSGPSWSIKTVFNPAADDTQMISKMAASRLKVTRPLNHVNTMLDVMLEWLKWTKKVTAWSSYK